MRALVTGGESGFGKELVVELGSKSMGISYTSGFDISIPIEREKILQQSEDFDVFVNFAHRNFDQTRLLYEVGFHWQHLGKKGHIFNIGSYGTHFDSDTFELWKSSKYSLDVAHKQFRKMREVGVVGFDLTLIRLGLLDTVKNRSHLNWNKNAHSPRQLARLIHQIYESDQKSLFSEVDFHWLQSDQNC